jgi:hypothetical protein
MNGIISSDMHFAALNLPGGYLGSKSCKGISEHLPFLSIKTHENFIFSW